MSLSAEAAVTVVRTLAGELGVRAEPRVVADRSNLVLTLDPEGVVARVAMATSLVRVGMTWLRREVELSRWLAAEGATVTVPSRLIDPGPHERAGLVISFWERESLTSERADAREAGAALATIHRALARYPEGRLPAWGGFHEAREVFARVRRAGVLDSRELARVEASWDAAERVVESAGARTASLQAVHGDAHIGNVLATARGAVWTDWEDAFVGPVEWDIASLRSKAELFGEEREAIEAMTEAYGHDYDPDLARDLGMVRNLQVVVWLAIFAERQPELLPRMRARLERLATSTAAAGR